MCNSEATLALQTKGVQSGLKTEHPPGSTGETGRMLQRTGVSSLPYGQGAVTSLLNRAESKVMTA